MDDLRERLRAAETEIALIKAEIKRQGPDESPADWLRENWTAALFGLGGLLLLAVTVIDALQGDVDAVELAKALAPLITAQP